MHSPYENKLGHAADFRVKYRFLLEKDGGRKTTPRQGYRSDFWYYHETQPNPNSIYMIWPEFENKQGEIILDETEIIENEGTARMWIIMPKMREFHKTKIVTGLKGFFREGSMNAAECEVIEILGLHSNPCE